MILQPATEAMVSALASLHAEAFGGRAWRIEQIAGSLSLETTQGWTAMDGDKLQGFILCQMMEGRSEILTLAVPPAAQRQGVGAKLLRKAFEAAAQLGSTTLFLEVAANNAAARALYEKHGFKICGGRPRYYRGAVEGGEAVDAVFYERTLSEQWLHKG